MSWTPQIWIRRSDYDKLSLDGKCEAWEFNIAEVDGVVLATGEASSTRREMHDMILSVPHWVLNDGEHGECSECRTWGTKISDCDT